MKKTILASIIIAALSFIVSSCDTSSIIDDIVIPDPEAACMEYSSINDLVTNLPRKVYFINNNEGWIRGYNSNYECIFLHTENGGESWIEMATGLDFLEADAGYAQFHFINSTDGFANTGYPETINYTTDKGDTWQEIDFGNLVLKDFYGIASNSTQTIVAAKTSVENSETHDRLYFISNSTHQVVSDLLVPFSLYDARDIHFTDSGIINISSYDSNFAHSEDFGANWTFPINDMESIYPFENNHDMVFPTDNVGYFTGYDSTNSDTENPFIYKTTNGGATWLKIEIETHSGLNLGQFAFSDENNGLALGHAAGDFGLYKTVDGGNNWELINCFNDILGPITLTTPVSLSYPNTNKGFVLATHNVNGDYEEFQPRLYKYIGQ